MLRDARVRRNPVTRPELRESARGSCRTGLAADEERPTLTKRPERLVEVVGRAGTIFRFLHHYPMQDKLAPNGHSERLQRGLCSWLSWPTGFHLRFGQRK